MNYSNSQRVGIILYLTAVLFDAYFVVDAILHKPLFYGCSLWAVATLFNYFGPVCKPNLMSDLIHFCTSCLKKPASFLDFLKFGRNHSKKQGGGFDAYARSSSSLIKYARIMYTTNIIEGLNRQYRKVTKTKSVSQVTAHWKRCSIWPA